VTGPGEELKVEQKPGNEMPEIAEENCREEFRSKDINVPALVWTTDRQNETIQN
jgi:hypothetical protein